MSQLFNMFDQLKTNVGPMLKTGIHIYINFIHFIL